MTYKLAVGEWVILTLAGRGVAAADQRSCAKTLEKRERPTEGFADAAQNEANDA